MARIRTIKPEFFLNEELAALPPHGRLLFVGLWTQADREGRLADRPGRLKAVLFPYEKVDVDGLLSQLSAGGFIARYLVGSERFLAITNFARHQYPHVKEPASTIPAPDSSGASPIPDPVEPAGREGKGKEGIGRGGVGGNGARRAARATTLPDDFPLTDRRRQFALDGGLADVPLLFAAFKDNHRAKGSLFEDWDAAWRTWCRREHAWKRDRQRGGPR